MKSRIAKVMFALSTISAPVAAAVIIEAETITAAPCIICAVSLIYGLGYYFVNCG